MTLPIFCRRHSHLIPEYLAHVFRVRIASQVCYLVLLQGRLKKQLFHPLYPVAADRLCKCPARLFLELGA